jgi:glucoamylase
MPELRYQRVQAALPQTDLAVVAPYMLQLMLRNVATSGFTFVAPPSQSEPGSPPRLSRPGCILASPSYPVTLPSVDQDYVHHWVRDAAVAAIEMSHQPVALGPDGVSQQLCDYVAFSKTCQDAAVADGCFYRAVFRIDGTVRPWSDQKDGPALQNLALVDALPRLDAASAATARAVAQVNLDSIVGSWDDDTNMRSPWEEVIGHSFFARAAQLRCLQEVRGSNALGLTVPAGLDDAITGLTGALDDHWDPAAGCYVSVLGATLPHGSTTDLSGYDPNVDVVMACIYGAVPCTDPRLLATAAKVREQYDVGGACEYPINVSDRDLGVGPLIGRYPSDIYDGDTRDDVQNPTRGHPWALCTANFAELYHRLARCFEDGDGIRCDELTGPFFAQVGLHAATVDDPAQAAAVAEQLRGAGDRMLQALIYHSDDYELSEQFDARTGYEKSVTNLTWSYAAYLSAVRAR